MVSDRDGAFALLSKVSSWLLVVTATLVALAMLVFSQAHLLPGHADRWYLAADLSTILFPYLMLITPGGGVQRHLERAAPFHGAGALADLAQRSR